jgi:hypothetical protein
MSASETGNHNESAENRSGYPPAGQISSSNNYESIGGATDAASSSGAVFVNIAA